MVKSHVFYLRHADRFVIIKSVGNLAFEREDANGFTEISIPIAFLTDNGELAEYLGEL